MSRTDSYEEAIARLREILANIDADEELKGVVSSRDGVIEKYSPRFSLERIDELTAEQFKEFLLFKNNRHWTGLARLGGSITKDMDKLRVALRELLDESIPVAKRIDRLMPDGKTRIPRLARAVITPILLVAYPDRYGVWNIPSQAALKAANLWPKFEKRDTIGHRYAKINELLLKLASDLGTDLWTLDSLLARLNEDGETDGVWLIRAGEYGEQEKSALENHVATIGFDRCPDLSTFDSRDAIAQHYRGLDPGMKPRGATNKAIQAWMFANEVSEGDVVLLPLRTEPGLIAVGEVTGEYAYVDLPDGVRHTLPVDWLGKVAKDKLPRNVAASLNAPKTINPVRAKNAAKRVLSVMEESEIRNSETIAKKVLEGFFPESSSRRAVLGAFVDSIRKAYSVSPGVFCVNLGRHMDRIRLNIGSAQAVRLTEGQVDFVIDESQLSENVRARLEDYIDRSYDYKLSEDLVDVIIPSERFETLYPLFREAHYAYIDHPQRGMKSTNVYRAHSPGVLKYLRTELGEEVPDPVLPKQTSGGDSPEEDPFPKFSLETFELLEQLHKHPTAEFLRDHKSKFEKHLIRPFKSIMKTVASRLPGKMLDVVETEKNVFSRIAKNDYGKGGAWDFYWGAFYPKGGRRIEDAQLALWTNRNRLEIGFFIGVYTGPSLKRFVKNVREHREQLEPFLSGLIEKEDKIVQRRAPDAPDRFEASGYQIKDLLDRPEEVNNIQIVIPCEEIVEMKGEELIELVRSTFERYFPFVLLTTSDTPLEDIGIEETEEEENPAHPVATIAAETGFDDVTLKTWITAINRKGQGVIYGPPGTGKTFVAKHLAKHLVGGGFGIIEVVQFHPAYSYEDFIQGLRPKPGDQGGLEFELVAGRFLQFCRKAGRREGISVLIIDEINRANLSRVLGELMYLLEYRNAEVPLASGGTLRIPENVRLIGTMNTADRSIAVVDHALRRRFAFIPLLPDYGLLERHLENSSVDATELNRVLRRLNDRIGDPHYSIGVSFFLVDDLEDHLESIWKMEIEPYIEEYFFDQEKVVAEFRWKEVGKILRKNIPDE